MNEVDDISMDQKWNVFCKELSGNFKKGNFNLVFVVMWYCGYLLLCLHLFNISFHLFNVCLFSCLFSFLIYAQWTSFTDHIISKMIYRRYYYWEDTEKILWYYKSQCFIYLAGDCCSVGVKY